MPNAIIATPRLSLAAAAAAARAAGLTPLILGDAIEGEAREVGTAFAGIAIRRAPRRAGAGPGAALGRRDHRHGAGQGRGGRNAEFLLGLALALDGAPGIFALAGDTDGIDGTEDIAGAIVTPDTLARAAALGSTARAACQQ